MILDDCLLLEIRNLEAYYQSVPLTYLLTPALSAGVELVVLTSIT